MPREIMVLDFLQAQDDAKVNVARVDTRRIRAWLSKMDESSREGVLRAWLVGRVLAAERLRLKRGEVKAWELRKARELGRGKRTLASYRYIAESLSQEKIAESLQVSHVDGGVDGFLRAIRKAKKGVDTPASTTNTDKAAAWKKRAQQLLKAVPKGRVGNTLLRELLQDVREMLGRAV